MALPLVISPEVLARAKELLAYAEAHRIGMDEMFRIFHGFDPPPGNKPEFAMVIPIGYTACFTITWQPPGWTRHLSVGIVDPKPGQYPSLYALSAIGLLFGMSGNVEDANAMWRAKDSPFNAVNYVEMYKPLEPKNAE